MTEFRALPVAWGDAFVIRSRRGSYLIGGGARPDEPLEEMIRFRGMRKLRVAVCPGFEQGQYGGLIRLAESSFPVSEWWMPHQLDLLCVAASGIQGCWDQWRKLSHGGWQRCESRSPSERGAPLAAEAMQERLQKGSAALALLAAVIACPDKIYASMQDGLQSFGNLVENGHAAINNPEYSMCLEQALLPACSWLLGQKTGLSVTARSQSDCTSLVRLSHQLLREYFAAQSPSNPAMVRGMRLSAAGSFASALQYTNVRMFRNTGQFEDGLIARHPFKGVNCHEYVPCESRCHSSAEDIHAIVGGKSSAGGCGLVFRYGEQECGVLLSADSDFSFLADRRGFKLETPMIVTAPRNGSRSREQVYGLPGMDEHTVWVRTGGSHSVRLAKGFLSSQRRYCLNCEGGGLSEVVLRFDQEHGQWQPVIGQDCTRTCPDRGR